MHTHYTFPMIALCYACYHWRSSSLGGFHALKLAKLFKLTTPDLDHGCGGRRENYHPTQVFRLGTWMTVCGGYAQLPERSVFPLCDICVARWTLVQSDGVTPC